ncbi:DNA double-strand break repair nuclease NurA [Methanobrevibacter sp. DSM 116169]|uniref:DNA double-strand break repair nuclease NurA n=1 Tax=Methanobrevibacter sp. DSM 116169 TaxID=3242727 RepID=UPI0038FC1240
MLDSLYAEAVRKKGLVNEIIDEFSEGDPRVLDKWNTEITIKSTDDFSIAAGDGSFNKKKFLSFYFYAIACESLVFDGKLKAIENVNIDTLNHNKFSEDLIRSYMGLYEAKSAFKTLKEFDVDYYLYDGSLLGDLIRPYPAGADLSERHKKEVIDNCTDDLEEKVKSLEVKIFSDEIIKKYFKSNVDTFEFKVYLTNLEKLIVMKHLLSFNKNIIAISKSSTSDDLFNSNIPDIAIFDKYTSGEGFSEIIPKTLSNEVKHLFPIEDEFFKNLEFSIFYLRLEDNKNILKVELPFKASKNDVIDIIEKLKKFSTEGYPYLLKKAHKDVVISNKNIDELANIVNFYEKSGREMLK